MKSLIVTTRDRKEFKLLRELLERLGVRYDLISVEKIEDDRLMSMMKGVDRKKRVTKASVLKKLRK